MAKARSRPPPISPAAPCAAMKDGASPAAGPLELIYGVETPVESSEIARQLSTAAHPRRANVNIRHLGFWGTRFPDTRGAFKTLGRKLKKHRRRVQVDELVVSGVPGVGNAELSSLAPYLNKTTTLRSLDLTGASFDAEAIKEVTPFFRRNSSLEALVLGENQCVGDEGVKTALAGLQAGKGKLRVLSVESCRVGAPGAASISRFMLRGGRSLRTLQLSNNNIGDAGAETLVRALKHSHRLGHLALNNTGITDRGASELGEVLRTNRTLHTLSLRNNEGITDVGASALLGAIYNTESIRTIIGSNHVLTNLTLGGCAGISRDLLKRSSQLSNHSRLLSDVRDVIRQKITTYLKQAEGGLALEVFDLELMPHLLAFVGKSGGATSLFQTVKSMPVLYTRYAPQENESQNREEKEATTKNGLPFLEQLRLSSKRARKQYAIFANAVPKRSCMLRYQDRLRIRNKHEADSASASNNSASSSFAQPLRSSCRSVVERAILLWLFHTRRVLHVFACALLKAAPRALIILLLCPQA
ncbi:hypothetical protein ACHAXT_012512 [Thalassiosira profunda]